MAGIYLHIPFCKQACSYCNFHFSTNLALKRNMLAALTREITVSAACVPIDTIYLGGGTPSLLDPAEINDLLTEIRRNFSVASNAEITIEANPDDITPAIPGQWLKMGINRLSLGVQSFNEEELRWMNRAHHATQSMESINQILEAGFTNFSVDLIYGSPLLTNEALISNINIVLEKNIPHVSAYALTVEPKTRLHKMISQHKSEPIDESRQAEQFAILVSLMEAGGYDQYEISNFARPGFRSRHNSSYWQGKPYYGFGPAAHSFDGNNIRRWNIANNALYIKSLHQNIVPYEEEILTPAQQLNETIMISLRTMEGLDMEKLKSRFGQRHVAELLATAQKYIDDKKLQIRDSKLILTREGKFFADGIAADLFVS